MGRFPDRIKKQLLEERSWDQKFFNPEGKGLDAHHIRPAEEGGSDSKKNAVLIDRDFHQKEITSNPEKFKDLDLLQKNKRKKGLFDFW